MSTEEPMFLKFVGPMKTLTQGKNKFERDKIYQVADHERAFDMIETTRFQQVRDPRIKKAPEQEAPRARGGVHINRTGRMPERPAAAPKAPGEPTFPGDTSERGDLSQDDLQQNGGSRADPVVAEVKEDGADHPRLPSQPFLSKKDAVDWADKNLDLKLDKTRSLTELNRKVEEGYLAKFGRVDDPAETDDDDTREENTKMDAIVVA